MHLIHAFTFSPYSKIHTRGFFVPVFGVQLKLAISLTQEVILFSQDTFCPTVKYTVKEGRNGRKNENILWPETEKEKKDEIHKKAKFWHQWQLTCAADSVNAQTATEASFTVLSNSPKSPDLILLEILGMASVRSYNKANLIRILK